MTQGNFSIPGNELIPVLYNFNIPGNEFIPLRIASLVCYIPCIQTCLNQGVASF